MALGMRPRNMTANNFRRIFVRTTTLNLDPLRLSVVLTLYTTFLHDDDGHDDGASDGVHPAEN